MKTAHRLTADYWQAIQDNNRQFDDCFFYGVTTTKIFCRPSCPSRLPKKEHILIFKTAEEALNADFRPCKRCQPTGEIVPNKEWIAQIKAFIRLNIARPLTLEIIAEECHGSPYHLHRVFKKITGETPLTYLLTLRIAEAKHLLLSTNEPIQKIAFKIGFASSAYFSTSFKQMTGSTPSDYRKQHLAK